METPESALPGIVAPPPLLYLGSFAAAILAQALVPWPILPDSPAPAGFGLALLALSAAFARWAFVAMRARGTSASPRKPSTALSVSGPFAHSRNPIYVAMTGLYLGATAVLDSWWPLLLLVPLLGVMQWGVVRREERYLLARFGEDYAAYTRAVRHWL